MPRTKVAVPNVAEADAGLWSNGIRAGDFLFISGQVARPFEDPPQVWKESARDCAIGTMLLGGASIDSLRVVAEAVL